MMKDWTLGEGELEAWPVWGTELFIGRHPYHDVFGPAVRALILEDAGRTDTALASGEAVAAKQGLQESPLDFLDREDPDLQALRQSFSDLVLDVAASANTGHWPEDAEAEAIITESWYHVTGYGGYHDAHSHPNCSWCGIYMLDSGDPDPERRSGVNRFYDPRTNAGHYLDAGSEYLNRTGVWDIALQTGEVVLFPSYLTHSALPYFGQRERIVIAFNTQVHFV